MPEQTRYDNNSQTIVFDADTFDFEPLETANGHATVVRFKLDNPRVNAGDVLLVLSGAEIHFHGMIGRVEDGYGVAVDRRGSLLPAATVQ